MDRLKWLYEEQGRAGALLVSTSKLIPSDDADKQPPHRQAANYYKGVAADLGGEWLVTMEHPTKGKPKPIVIEIGASGAKVRKVAAAGAGAVLAAAAPRAGRRR